MKIILRVVLLALLFTLGWGFYWVQSFKPDYHFTLHSEAVNAPVDILFDDMGVPHIYANSEQDAMFALGHVHASERLWQMDLLRRAGAGELSALLGEDMVDNDQYLRTLGMRKAARRTVEQFVSQAPQEIQRAMRAYLQGINAFIQEGRIPVEYQLLRTQPEPFNLEDVYCATGFMAYTFAIHLKTEPILDWMKSRLTPAHWSDLAVGPEGFTRIPVEKNAADTLLSLRDISGLSKRVIQLDELRPVPQWMGSNAWVISGEKTASGKVIFCNDAHMAYAQPSVWYEAHVVAPGLDYYGNHLAGLPFPAIGHTRNHAWGITMFVNDDIDLYRETIRDGQYLQDGEWRDLISEVDTIHIADQKPLAFEILSTPHGPLIEEDISMWWTFTQYPENRLHEAFYGFSRMGSIEAFEESAALVHAPGLNLMYGDQSGNIAWWASAKLPIRPEHVDTKTAIDGTQSANDPQGWYPFSMNPRQVNPASGFVYSANNAPDSVLGLHIPGHYYSGNTRAAGIMNALSTEKADWTVEDAQKLQLDGHSLVYAQNTSRMLSAISDASLTEEAAAMANRLRDWTGSHELGEIVPTLYYRWMYRAIEGAMADEFAAHARDEADAAEKFETFHRTIVSENTFPRLLENLESVWWDDVETEGVETAREVLASALEQALVDLQEQLGPDTSEWTYDRLHTVTHHHAMKDVPILGSWLGVGPFRLPAAKDALNKYEFKLKQELNFDVFSGPSMRIGIDFADVEAAESILPTGQSGNVLSPFYDNQAPLYHSGRFRKQRMNRAEIEANCIGKASIFPKTSP